MFRKGLLKIWLSFVYLVRFVVPKTQILVLPPTDEGSLGDEAMLTALCGKLGDMGLDKINVITFYASKQLYPISNSKSFDMSSFFRWGSIKSQFLFLFNVITTKKFFVLGADVMDGFYDETRSLRRMHLLDLAQKSGCPAALLGFSFKNSARPSCIEKMKKLNGRVAIHVRDPHSHQRLLDSGVHLAKLVTDMAFMLKPDGQSRGKEFSNTLSWIKQKQDEGTPLLGLNLNFTMLWGKGIPKQEVIESYIVLVKQILATQPFSIVFIPHDKRATDECLSDWQVAYAIRDQLSDGESHRFLVCPETMTAANVKHIAGEIDLVLTGRMHLAIAAFGQITPVVGLGYQDKFKGMFSHVGIERNVLEAEAVKDPDALIEKLQSVYQEKVTQKQTIASRLKLVSALSYSQVYLY